MSKSWNDILGDLGKRVHKGITEDANNKRVSGGVYSVLNNKWIKEPVAQDIPDIDKEALDRALSEWESKFNDAKESNDVETIDNFIDSLYNYRQEGLNDGGEFSIQNLVFKEIRNNGELEELKELKTRLTQDELSLNEEMIKNNTKLLFDKMNAKVGVNYAIVSSDTNGRDILDKEKYEKAKSRVERGIKQLGVWDGGSETSYIIKASETTAKRLTKDLCQQGVITFKFLDEYTINAKSFSANDDNYTSYKQDGESNKILVGKDAEGLEYHSELNGLSYALGLYGVEETDACKSLTEKMNESNTFELNNDEKYYYIDTQDDEDVVNDLIRAIDKRWFLTTDPEYDEYGEVGNGEFDYILVIGNESYDALTKDFVMDMFKECGTLDEFGLGMEDDSTTYYA